MINEMELLKYKIERIYKKNKKIIKLDNNERQLIDKCKTISELKNYRRNLKEYIKYKKFVSELDDIKPIIEIYNKPELDYIKPEVPEAKAGAKAPPLPIKENNNKLELDNIKPIIENNNKLELDNIKPIIENNNKLELDNIKPIIENNNNVLDIKTNIESDFKPVINIDDKIKLFNQNRLIEDLNIKLINYKKIIKQLTTENKKLNDIFNNNNTSDTNSNTTEEEEDKKIYKYKEVPKLSNNKKIKILLNNGYDINYINTLSNHQMKQLINQSQSKKFKRIFN
uniref:Uncharacterized protein n=1 Tax=viral metagenome TaxID=1070528 RepID=A0A6C0EDH8_9ZZZZ